MFGCRKTFSGKYIFSGNANFRKRKIFPCVWLHFKKFSGKYFLMFGKEEGKDKLKKNIINDRDSRSRSRRRDRRVARSRLDRDLDRRRNCDQLRDLATARDRAVNRDLHGDRRTGDQRRLELRVHRRSSDWLFGFFSSHARALSLSLSLSLSLFPEMLWSENEGRKSFPGQRWKYWSTGSHFPENIIFCDSQTCGKGWKWFPEIIFTQNKRTLRLAYPQRALRLENTNEL